MKASEMTFTCARHGIALAKSMRACEPKPDPTKNQREMEIVSKVHKKVYSLCELDRVSFLRHVSVRMCVCGDLVVSSLDTVCTVTF